MKNMSNPEKIKLVAAAIITFPHEDDLMNTDLSPTTVLMIGV